ncbi:ROX3 [Candida oxycetoniae]|uniref:Mediator of RNA polymerase II transcription subunit 19 n=1 Tax=Candida oxycetoniae TaxID=497107 RepID=A0AAI9SW60_9ASCO|nr:ROX3 [Candida oxycetoniae]KAI3404211.2 ROX3 [Candida oxycetoniae]
MTNEQTKRPDEYYLVDTGKTYKPSRPTPLDNLVRLYNLEPIAKQLARTNPDGSKNVKLRKSYKAHIQDLPGKHQIPPSKSIAIGLMDPSIPRHPDIIREFDQDLLGKALRFDRTPISGIPGFNALDLAVNDQQTGMGGGGDDIDEDGKSRKRKKKTQLGVSRASANDSVNDSVLVSRASVNDSVNDSVLVSRASVNDSVNDSVLVSRASVNDSVLVSSASVKS